MLVTGCAGKAIGYVYDFNRLIRINYPVSTAVEFTYGKPGARENAAGRVTRVIDEAGEETRGYGTLGEVVRSTRSVASLHPGQPATEYTTHFDFDSFGRMQSVTYPDGEVVSYGYDSGGLLKSAEGQGSGRKQTYVKLLQYDEFGQRVHLELGNGGMTDYQYEPRTRRLQSVRTTLTSRKTL